MSQKNCAPGERASSWRVEPCRTPLPCQRMGSSTARVCVPAAALQNGTALQHACGGGSARIRAAAERRAPAVCPSGAPLRRSSSAVHIAADGSACEGMQLRPAHARDGALQLRFKARAVAASTFELSHRHRLAQRSAELVPAAAAQGAPNAAVAQSPRFKALRSARGGRVRPAWAGRACCRVPGSLRRLKLDARALRGSSAPAACMRVANTLADAAAGMRVAWR
jgi:hypothetical protein